VQGYSGLLRAGLAGRDQAEDCDSGIMAGPLRPRLAALTHPLPASDMRWQFLLIAW